MGYYADRVLPRIINAACGMKSSEPFRRRVCEGLHGNVVEIGFGSGHNVPFYPPDIVGVTAIEPADLAWQLADGRLAATTIPVTRERPRRTAFAARRRQPGHRAVDLDDVHHSGHRLRAGGAPPSPEARRDTALRRARSCSRRQGAALATPSRTSAEAAVRRLSPHATDHRPAHRRRLRGLRTRRVLRARRPEVPRGRHPGHCPFHLTVARRVHVLKLDRTHPTARRSWITAADPAIFDAASADDLRDLRIRVWPSGPAPRRPHRDGAVGSGRRKTRRRRQRSTRPMDQLDRGCRTPHSSPYSDAS